MQSMRRRGWLVAAAAALSLATAFTSGAAAAPRHKAAAPDVGLINPGQLTVGMTLQFAPEMYIDKKTHKPAGYDVQITGH